MKKTILSLVAFATLASAANYEFTPLAGGVIKEGNLGINDEFIFGGEFQFNNVESTLKPELSIFYSPEVEYDINSNKKTDFTRVALNGVYDYKNVDSFTPFAKIGFGYEEMSHPEYGNLNSMFGDIGGGVKVPFSDALSFKLETIYMLKHNNARNDSNLAILAGLTFSFGQEDKKEVVVLDDDKDGVENKDDSCLNTPSGVKVNSQGCAVDSDWDGVADYKDKCVSTISGVKVDSQGCALDSDSDGVADYLDTCTTTLDGVKVDAKGCPLDSDGDGVADYLDKCMNTLKGLKVDANGCPVKVDLLLTFETSSTKLDSHSEQKVVEFAEFLKANVPYKVTITGYTDSIGSAKNNARLSLKRADAVKKELVKNGVNATRLTTQGKGELDPIADNTTKAGQAKNRRIEVELH